MTPSRSAGTLGGWRKIQAGHLPAAIMLGPGNIQDDIRRPDLWRGRGWPELHAVSIGGIEIDEHDRIFKKVVAVGIELSATHCRRIAAQIKTDAIGRNGRGQGGFIKGNGHSAAITVVGLASAAQPRHAAGGKARLRDPRIAVIEYGHDTGAVVLYSCVVLMRKPRPRVVVRVLEGEVTTGSHPPNDETSAGS